ncbi:hypothetical protein NFI96_034277 [Prochilodus magdalenae]|nr:hypothetical protein NFI96_034277 [Prochilodus magdalenae]
MVSESLQINTGITKELVVDFHRAKHSPPVPVNIQGMDIKIVRSYKYLGVHLNDKLDWTDNNAALYSKGQSRLHLLRRLRMRVLIAVAVLVVMARAASVSLEDLEFHAWKEKFGKSYGSEEEESQRKMIWLDNRKMVLEHNLLADQGIKSYRLGMNQFSDMARFSGCLGSFNITEVPSATADLRKTRVGALPSHVDWWKEGYVTPVKNQQMDTCLSCWAFAATGALEGQMFRNTRQLISLSEQQLVDCSREYGNNGCNRGWPHRAFEYMLFVKGLEAEITYPYLARNGWCQYKPQNVVATCHGYYVVSSGDENYLKYFVATIGPIAVAIDASQASFRHYKSGVYDEPLCSSNELNHAVLVVGYGRERQQDYWLVKNRMRVLIAVAVLVVMARAASVSLEDLEFHAWKEKFGKSYGSEEEESQRKMIWLDNRKMVLEHNKLADQGIKSYRLGMNQFADMDDQEYKSRFSGCLGFINMTKGHSATADLRKTGGAALPSHVDWRTQGFVTPVKNQQQDCESCWAFSAVSYSRTLKTGALEGQVFRKTKQLFSLSEQQLVDCSRKFGNKGCQRGWPHMAFEYIKSAGGLETEKTYPYEARNGVCRFTPQNAKATCYGYKNQSGDENYLQHVVATVGPISVGIHATRNFGFYKSGVFYDPSCSTDVNHAVLVVGYGREGQQDYWLVKNRYRQMDLRGFKSFTVSVEEESIGRTDDLWLNLDLIACVSMTQAHPTAAWAASKGI